MGNRPYTMIAGIILLVVAAAHLLRIVDGWRVTIADSIIPMSVSYVAVVIAGFIGAMLLREARR